MYKEMAFKRLRLILCLPLGLLSPQMTRSQSNNILITSLLVSGYLHSRILSTIHVRKEGVYDFFKGIPIRENQNSNLQTYRCLKFASEHPRLLRRHIMMFIRSTLRYLSPETLKKAIECERWSVKCQSYRKK